MAETPKGEENTEKKEDESKGTDPEKTEETPSSQEGFDPAKVSDSDFEKIFEDKRLFQHPRFKSLNERAKKAEELEKAQEEAEKKKLEEDNKYKELAEKLKTEKAELEGKFKQQAIDNLILAEAQKAGIKDTDAALKLLDRAGITEKDGNIEGVADAIKSLTENRPYLVTGEQKTPIGSGTNPGETEESIKKFKLSDVNNPEFYKAHAKEIDEAMKVPGGIVDDTAQ